MLEGVLHNAMVNTDKYSGVLITGTDGIAVEKIIFDFHSVSKDYFPAAVLTDEENSGCRLYYLQRAELVLKNKLAL